MALYHLENSGLPLKLAHSVVSISSQLHNQNPGVLLDSPPFPVLFMITPYQICFQNAPQTCLPHYISFVTLLVQGEAHHSTIEIVFLSIT